MGSCVRIDNSDVLELLDEHSCGGGLEVESLELEQRSWRWWGLDGLGVGSGGEAWRSGGE